MTLNISKKTFSFALISAIILFSVLFISGCIGNSVQEQKDLKVGDVAPDLLFTVLDGQNASVSDFKGKIVLLNFWGIGCPPCRAEMPAFEALQREYQDDLVVLTINCQDSESVLREFKESVEPSYILGRLKDRNCPYPISSIPYTVIIDRDGKIAFIQIGAGSAEIMYNKIYKPEIEKLLN